MSYVPTKQNHHRYISHEIKSFLDTHFGCADYDGFVWLATNQHFNRNVFGCPGNDKGFQHIKAVRLSELSDFICQMHFSKHGDYYLTANVLTSATSRRSENAFTLNNIVIDIDCHLRRLTDQNAMLSEVERVLENELFLDGVIAAPNTIVRTGRGLQLWWALEPQYIKRGQKPCVKMYEWLKRTWCALIAEALRHNPSTNMFSVDTSSTCNLVGLFRLPFTVNTKTRTMVTVHQFHTVRYDLYALVDKEYPIVLSQKEYQMVRESVYDGMPTTVLDREDEAILAGIKGGVPFRRVLAMLTLRALRDASEGEEMRDITCWVVYNALRYGKIEPDDALARTLSFNLGFRRPLPERELVGYLRSSMRRDRYKMTNDTIIEKLSITQEEQAVIRLYPSGNTTSDDKNTRCHEKLECARELRTLKRGQIIALYRAGKNNSQIARETGFSRPTVIKYVQMYEKGALDQRYIDVSDQYLSHWNAGIEENTDAMEAASRKNSRVAAVTRKKVSAPRKKPATTLNRIPVENGYTHVFQACKKIIPKIGYIIGEPPRGGPSACLSTDAAHLRRKRRHT